jgi:chemotaxis protein MotB
MMGKKKVHHEEHVDETWLIPYADMLTLLLALFIVMFAMSQVDKEKLKKVSEQFNVIFSGGTGIINGEGAVAVPIEGSGGTGTGGAALEENKMKDIKEVLEQEIEGNGYSDKVIIELNDGGLEISIQDVVLFNSGDAAVLSKVSPLLLQISSMLRGLDNEIRVVGHTDNVPINNSKFRSNWELSSMRAINVMNFMINSGGLKPEHLSIQAYADQMPKYNNSTEEGRAKNRRVEIFIVRKYPAAEDKKTE